MTMQNAQEVLGFVIQEVLEEMDTKYSSEDDKAQTAIEKIREAWYSIDKFITGDV